jgi:multidrug efflux system membrane fusion protein
MNFGFQISDFGLLCEALRRLAEQRLRAWRRGSLCCILGVLLVVSCVKSPQQGKTRGRPSGQPVPVTVADAVAKTMPVQVQAVGRAEAYASVAIGAQVDGPLLRKHFVEGQYVKTGDLLFTIDSRPYEAQLKQSQANLAKDKAQLENALSQLERNAAVVEKGYVSKEQYDQAVAAGGALKASVAADEAAIENAQLQVQYCSIKSPIDGVVGALEVDPGNLVKANDTANPLVVVNQIQPIYIGFFVPERNLPTVRQYMASGKPQVEVTIPGQQGPAALGELTFLDNTVNTTSGTIQLRATFANEERSLWPGQFVNVTLVLAEQPGAVVIPSQAIQTGQQGQYVFVVKPDNTVEDRPIVVARSVDNESVIEKGVAPGERVVTDGQLRLTAGSHIKIAPPVGEQEMVP